jgi:hypothetical protein
VVWGCVPACPLYYVVEELAAVSMSSSVLRGTFRVNLSLTRSLN